MQEAHMYMSHSEAPALNIDYVCVCVYEISRA